MLVLSLRISIDCFALLSFIGTVITSPKLLQFSVRSGFFDLWIAGAWAIHFSRRRFEEKRAVESRAQELFSNVHSISGALKTLSICPGEEEVTIEGHRDGEGRISMPESCGRR